MPGGAIIKSTVTVIQRRHLAEVKPKEAELLVAFEHARPEVVAAEWGLSLKNPPGPPQAKIPETTHLTQVIIDFPA